MVWIIYDNDIDTHLVIYYSLYCNVNILPLAVNNPEEALDNDDVLYFNTEKIDGVENWFQHGDHWFGW